MRGGPKRGKKKLFFSHIFVSIEQMTEQTTSDGFFLLSIQRRRQPLLKRWIRHSLSRCVSSFREKKREKETERAFEREKQREKGRGQSAPITSSSSSSSLSAGRFALLLEMKKKTTLTHFVSLFASTLRKNNRRASEFSDSPTYRTSKGNEAAFPWSGENALAYAFADDAAADDDEGDDHRPPPTLQRLQRYQLSDGVTLLVEEAKHESDLTVRKREEEKREKNRKEL